MPTGYTYKVEDGTMTSARDFLLNYAKRYGIGYFITKQGELPMPKEYSSELAEKAVTDYHTKELEKAKSELESFNKLSEQELKAKYDAYVAKKLEDNKRLTEENALKTQRYLDMINKVSKWDAPSELAEMKASAIAHLEESKEFDCKLHLDTIHTYDGWLKGQREHYVWNVNYHSKEKASEDKRRVEMDTLLKAFYQSLDKVE